MWASAHRRFGLVLVALVMALLCSPLDAQENQKKLEAGNKPVRFDTTEDGVATQASVLMIGVHEPYAVLGTRLLAIEHPNMERWAFPKEFDFWITDESMEIGAAL